MTHYLKDIIPDGWRFCSSLGSKVIMVEDKERRLGILKKGADWLVDRLNIIESYGHTPKVYYYEPGCMILEYINGTNWKVYLDSHSVTDKLAHWYILESLKIYNDIGGHGDYVWYNVIITPDNQLKWIDLGIGNDDWDEFINQLYMHLYRKYSKDYITNMINRNT